MFTFTNVLLILNTALLVYTAVKLEELWRKKRWDDWVEESKRESAEEKSMIEFYGNLDGLLKGDPIYVASKQLKRLKILGLPKREISEWITAFMVASVEGKKTMMGNIAEYLLAATSEKKKILEKWSKI